MFELLVCALLILNQSNTLLMVYYNNPRVVNSWKKKIETRTYSPILLSRGSTISWYPLHIGYLQNMLLMQTTQPMDHPVEGIPLPYFYSYGSPYPRRSMTMSSTLMISGGIHSTFNINFVHLSTLPTSRSQTACPFKQISYSDVRASTSAYHIKTVLPYSFNLTPTSSNLHHHCMAKDWLEEWLLHSDLPPFFDLPAALEFQERVQMVTLQGWEEHTYSTCTTYNVGLLVFHVFCDSKEGPEKNHAPVKATFIFSFISTLVGSLSDKTIYNYIYSIQAWHTLYRLPRILHKD